MDSDFPYLNECILREQDRRKLVSEMRKNFYPNDNICLVVANNGALLVYGTGFLISSIFAVTSAHLFLTHESIKAAQPYGIYTNLHGKIDAHHPIKIVNYRISEKYSQIMKQISQLNQERMKKQDTERQQISSKIAALAKESSKYDYALLQLESSIKKNHYFLLHADFHEEKRLTVAGFDINHMNQAFLMEHSNENNKNSSNKAVVIGDESIMYDIDTTAGQSGGPVYYIKSNDEVVIVGIHKGYQCQSKLNCCTKITDEFIDEIQGWIEQLSIKMRVINRASAKKKEAMLRTQVQSLKDQLKITEKTIVNLQCQNQAFQIQIMDLKRECENFDVFKEQLLGQLHDKEQIIKAISEGNSTTP